MSMNIHALGIPVRVGTRDYSRTSLLFEGYDVDVCTVDFDKLDTLSVAMVGVKNITLMMPFSDKIVHYTENVVHAGRRADITNIIFISAAGAASDSPVSMGALYGKAEKDISSYHWKWTILQPTFLMNSMYRFQENLMRLHGVVFGCSSNDIKISYIHPRDVAAVAIDCLIHSDEMATRTLVLTGGPPSTNYDICKQMSGALGLHLDYKNVPDQVFEKYLIDNGISKWQTEAMLALEGAKASGGASACTSTVSEVLSM